MMYGNTGICSDHGMSNLAVDGAGWNYRNLFSTPGLRASHTNDGLSASQRLLRENLSHTLHFETSANMRNISLLLIIALILATRSSQARQLANDEDDVGDNADGSWEEYQQEDSGGGGDGADGADVNNDANDMAGDDGGAGEVVSNDDDLYDYANVTDDGAGAVMYNDDDLFDLLFFGEDDTENRATALRHQLHRNRLRLIFLATFVAGMVLYGCFCCMRKKREREVKDHEENDYVNMKSAGVMT
jgi:hypothetical protein